MLGHECQAEAKYNNGGPRRSHPVLVAIPSHLIDHKFFIRAAHHYLPIRRIQSRAADEVDSATVIGNAWARRTSVDLMENSASDSRKLNFGIFG